GADVSDAQLLEGPSGQVVASNFAPAARGPELPSELASTLWWEWSAPHDGTFTFATHGSAFDTILRVYRATSEESRIEIAANDDDGDVLTSSVSFEASEGESYHIRVDMQGNDDPGLVTLNWEAEDEPAEDSSQALPAPNGGPTQLFATSSFAGIPIEGNTGEKPQSKLWQHDGAW